MRPLEDIERDTRRQGAAYLSIGPHGRYEVWGYEADDDLRDLIARVRELEAAIGGYCSQWCPEDRACKNGLQEDCPLYPYRKGA